MERQFGKERLEAGWPGKSLLPTLGQLLPTPGRGLGLQLASWVPGVPWGGVGAARRWKPVPRKWGQLHRSERWVCIPGSPPAPAVSAGLCLVIPKISLNKFL